MSEEHNDLLKARLVEAQYRIKDLERENQRLLDRLKREKLIAEIGFKAEQK